MNTPIGIAFGSLWVKIKVTITKNRKMVSGQYLELGVRFYNQTWCIACLYEDPGWGYI
jgi:hypothetical protein